jgi:predicted CXXCH cytochrome family protein
MSTRPRLLGGAALVLAGMAGLAHAQAPPKTPRELFNDDVHAKAGLTCESCHKGAVNGQYGAVERTAIAPLCASCHSDAAVMRRAKPDARIDQHALYLTSTHGKQMSKGETRVATCSDCHGSHGLAPIKDARSPVAPKNVATTCARCHADPDRMSPFDRTGNPEEDWRKSVHAAALLQKGDTSAPTCSTCHGSHGPASALVTSLLVCAECHVREAELYTKSSKKKAFDKIDEPGCLTCHSHHEVEHPADSWVSMKDPALCSVCHDDTVKGAADIVAVEQGLGRLGSAIDRARQVLTRAEEAGMLVDDGLAGLRDAEEQQVLARLTVHAFAAKPFMAIADKGAAAASRAEQVGHDALAELEFRRKGLAVATLFIVGFLITLWIKIRRLPPLES